MFADVLAELSLHSEERRDVAINQFRAVLGTNVVVYRIYGAC
jgi:hypothetical protein